LLYTAEHFRILVRARPSLRLALVLGSLRFCHFVATRPVTSNGMGFSVDFTRDEVGKIERVLTLLPDSAAMYAEWKRLVFGHNVLGSKVHDARLAAAMNVHGVRRILTFNTGDFIRYQVAVLHPSDVVS
jgi:hypothetical protein